MTYDQAYAPQPFRLPAAVGRPDQVDSQRRLGLGLATPPSSDSVKGLTASILTLAVRWIWKS